MQSTFSGNTSANPITTAPITAPSLPWKDKVYLTGLILLLISLTFFLVSTSLSDLPFDDGYFFGNYVCALIYLVVLLANNRLKRGNGIISLPSFFLFLVLSLLSCYALNRSMPLFEASTPWWSTLLIISCINYIAFVFFHRFPSGIKALSCFIAGVSIIAFLYLALYLFPTYILGILASPLLGLSLHVFVPLLFVIYTLFFIRGAACSYRHTLHLFLAGIGFAVLFTVQFTVRWDLAVTRLNKDLKKTAANAPYPAWITVAQHCSGSSMEEEVLKTGLVYTSLGDWEFNWMPHRLFDEKRRHDPLIALSSLLCGSSNLNDEQRVSILKALYDSRHQAQRRLWRGDDLVTTNISTDVELWPQYHLSYTEEDITVASSTSKESWNTSQEAIYTFHLPEGGVVSALSLWINGREEKGLVASRRKADSAYNTIVGQYRRDPSVVHWQEGNTVVVRVYPVQNHESRRFKIGVTAPLEKQGSQLGYQSLWFDGPPSANATSSIRILPQLALINPQFPDGFESDSLGHRRYPPSLLSTSGAALAPIRHDGAYEPDWTLHFGDPGVAAATFTFNGRRYTTDVYTPETEPAEINQAYLDLNNSWTPLEYEDILRSLTGKLVYTSMDGIHLLTINSTNQSAIFDTAATRRFSLFPLHLITDQEHSLLITKSSSPTPNLSDLGGSPFSNQLQAWLEKGGKVRCYNLGEEVSPYLKALKEGGAFRFEKGGSYTLLSHLHHNTFAKDASASGVAVVDPAAILIRRSDAPADSTLHLYSPTLAAPDHLLRLFAYREVLQQLKGHLPGTVSDAAGADSTRQVQIAREASIVTPVSSLVVLESPADYARFNIHDSRNSLHNASLEGKGAAPEPGEWAIGIGILALLAYIRFSRGRRKHSIPSR